MYGAVRIKPKADFLLAGFAVRKVFAADHHDLVRFAMLTVVDHFVDAGLANHFSGTIAPAAIRPRAAVTGVLDASGLQLKCDFLLWRNSAARYLNPAFRKRAGRVMGKPPIVICLLFR